MKVNLEMCFDNGELAIRGIHLEGDFSPVHLRIVMAGVERIIAGRDQAIRERDTRPRAV